MFDLSKQIVLYDYDTIHGEFCFIRKGILLILDHSFCSARLTSRLVCRYLIHDYPVTVNAF